MSNEIAAPESGDNPAQPGSPSVPAPPAPPALAGCGQAAANPTPLELEVYRALATLFNSEETSFWTRNNILVVVQGGLIAATASIVGNADRVLSAGSSPKSAVLYFAALLVIALVGLATAVGWLYMVGRSEMIADTISQQLKNIETELSQRQGVHLGANFLAFQTFGIQLDPSSRSFDKPKRSRFNRHRLSNVWAGLGRGLALLWLVISALFAAALISGYATPEPAIDTGASAWKAAAAATAAAASAATAAEHSASAARIAMTAAVQAADAAERSASAARSAARQRIVRTPPPTCQIVTMDRTGACAPCAASAAGACQR